MILVDTSVWIDFLRGGKSVYRDTLHKFIEEEQDIAITEIILTEILQGIRKDKDFQSVKSYLLEFPIYSPVSPDSYLRAAGIYRDCRKRGKTVRKTVDCIIAAVCIEKNLTLFHNDTDFDLIETCTKLKCYKV